MVAFALAGFVLSVPSTAPPLRLKKRGLGESDVLVWGPLMVCGTYYAAVGTVGWNVALASLPYGLLCTTVADGQAHRQYPLGPAARHPDAAADPRRSPRPCRHAAADGLVLSAGGGGGGPRGDAVAGDKGWRCRGW